MSTRRTFLASGIMLPAATLASHSLSRLSRFDQKPAVSTPVQELRFRTLGKTGLKVTTVGFGCMITSDGSVVERAADMGINYFDTARGYMRQQ